MGYHFQFIDHTADVGIEFMADSLEELYQGGGEIFCDLVCDRQSIRGVHQKTLEIKKPSWEEKFQGLLNELLYLFDADHFLFSSVKVQVINEEKLVVTLEGEKIDPARHQIKLGIKGATYHQLKVWEENGKWKGRVIFDV